MRNISFFALMPLLLTASAFATVTVTSPSNGGTVSSPFVLGATGSSCSSQPISAMGYSFDNSANTTIVNGAAINTPVSASAGAHILRVKSWGNRGASCTANVSITVQVQGAPVVSTPPGVPANATAVKLFENLTKWNASFDVATGSGDASSSGTTGIVTTPSVTGSARQFAMNYSRYGGERFNVTLANDATASNFLYDVWLYLASPSNDIANIEMDMNQTMANGQTVIYGMQCDGWSKTWDYTTNSGSPSSPVDKWLHSNQTCDPQTWTTNTWHHVQLSYSRDGSGNITYNSVWLDSVQQEINETVPSAFALGWAKGGFVTNLQIDGMTSTAGSATVYMDNAVFYRW